jgi:trypsin
MYVLFQADAGGPLVGSGRLVGIVSGALGCARPNLPTFFSKVSNLRTWILNNAV